MYQFDSKEIRSRASEILDLDIPENAAEKLSVYAHLLLKWNKSYNLTSINVPEDVMTLHLMDSLSLVKRFDELMGESRKTVMDVGSGGGLPAIPLAVMRPDLSIEMVDAVQKKTIFLRQCIAMCRLGNAKVHHARIEKLKIDPVDVVTSRAFASLADMVNLTKDLLKPDGYWLAMKGKYPQDEINELPADVELVNFQKVDIGENRFERHLLVLRKK